MARIDDVEIVEIVRQVVALAHEVDDFADGPEGRDGDEVALHQPPGAVFREAEAFLQHIAQRLRDRVQYLPLFRFLERRDQVQGVVGFELGD